MAHNCAGSVWWGSYPSVLAGGTPTDLWHYLGDQYPFSPATCIILPYFTQCPIIPCKESH